MVGARRRRQTGAAGVSEMEANMNKRTVAFCCFVWAGVIFSASPAEAIIVTTESITSVRVSSQVVYSEATFCDGTIQTYYLQRMRIGRKWMWVPVDRIYSAGSKDLVLEDSTCSDGTNVYETLAGISAVAASRYRELALPASPDRLDGKANTQRGEYCSPYAAMNPTATLPPTVERRKNDLKDIDLLVRRESNRASC